MSNSAREFHELFAEADTAYPASRLYHEQSKLNEHSGLEFRERLAEFGADLERIRSSTRALKAYPGQPRTPLHDGRSRWRSRRLAALLRGRRTRRDAQSRAPLARVEWGSLLLRAAGVTGATAHPDAEDIVQPLRAWPSGGGLYPLETYVVSLNGELGERCYYFDPLSSELVTLGADAVMSEWREATYADGLWEPEPAGLVVVSAVLERTQQKYGERGYRFALLDAGHLGQNLLLVGEDLGIDLVPLGGFHDEGVGRLLQLDSTEEIAIHLFLVRGRRH